MEICARVLPVQLYVHNPPKIAEVVKPKSSVHKHTEWSDAIPVGNVSIGFMVVDIDPVVFVVAVPSMLSSPLPLLLLPLESEYMVGVAIVSSVLSLVLLLLSLGSVAKLSESVMVVLSNVGFTVVVVVVLSSLVSLSGSVVMSVVTDGGLETGSGEPCRLGHRLQGKIGLKVLASQSGKLKCVCVCVCVCDGRRLDNKLSERFNKTGMYCTRTV